MINLVETRSRGDESLAQTQTLRIPLITGRRRFQAAIFDMDGVVTKTASVHAQAWKQMFDAFLQQYYTAHGQPFLPFDSHHDYLLYVDGKARSDGVRGFLESRGIVLPEGTAEDPPTADTVEGLGTRKNQLFLDYLKHHKVEVYPSTVEFIQQLKHMGLQVAVISASCNAKEVLESAGVLTLFDTKVDGIDVERLHLKGKPAPDIFCQAASQLGAEPAHVIVIEDALAGVQAGHAGEFALVIGLNRANQAQLLKSHGADLVVNDLSDIVLVPEEKIEPVLLQSNPWQLVYEGYFPESEGVRETMCTLGNGYFATRGALFCAQDDGIHYPGTYLAGGYNRLKSEVGNRTVENEDLVNFPNWLSLNFRIVDEEHPEAPEEWFSIDRGTVLFYRQTLNLQQGILYRNIQFRDAQGRESMLIERRFVHMQHLHLAGLEVTLVPLNWQGRIVIKAALDGRVINNNVVNFRGLSNRHLQPLESSSVDGQQLFLKMQTTQSQLRVAQAARVQLTVNEQPMADVDSKVTQLPDYIAREYQLDVAAHDTVMVQKTIAFYNSQDNAISECGLEAMKAVSRAPLFADLVISQERVWRHLWDHFDVEISTLRGEDQALYSLLLRLHAFHVLQTVSPNSIDLDTDIPARGWHGEAYRGHIFWDNLFVFPFLNFRMADITESLLKYRYRRLPEARSMAAQSGFEGALYPWQSGSNGEEETPLLVYAPTLQQWLPEYTNLQRHVNASVVYNIWSYYQVTGDVDFLYAYGAEMMIEVARFWASASTYNAELSRYEIKGVVGPDEYHQRYLDRAQTGIDNNAYTNIMAVWCLCRALEVLEIMPDDHRADVKEQLNICPGELARWDLISRKMRVDFFGNGLISQFEGYGTLKEFPWDEYAKKHGSFRHIDEVMAAEGISLNDYKIAKQADVLMLFYLFSAETLRELFERLGYQLLPEAIPRNINYYSRRTVHGSSLSRIANAWVLARSSRRRSWSLFVEALLGDVADTQGGTTPEGIHLGAMGGTLDLVQRCYTGLELRNDVLWFNPALPSDLMSMHFSVHYRDNLLRIRINHKHLHIYISHCRARSIQVGLREEVHTLEAGRDYEFSLEQPD